MNTTKLLLKHQLLNSIFLAILLAISGFASAQTIPGNCRALIDIQNDLWFVKPDGSPVLQLTHDGRQKYTVGGVSPDGEMIAYLDESFGQDGTLINEDITLIDVTGKLLSKINLHAEGGITGLAWINAKLLQAGEHISPHSSSFHFVEVPNGGLHLISLQELPTVEGVSCTPSPNYRDIACISSLYRDGISLNGNDRDIYSTTDSFVSAVELQTLDIAVGSTVTTTTVPPFKLEVTEIVDNQVGLKVVTPDDLLQNQTIFPMFIAHDYTMPVPIKDPDSPDEIPPTVYGFTAAIKHHEHEQRGRGRNSSEEKEDRKAAIVTVHVLKSVTGAYSLEGDLAWSPDGRRIATVEKNDLGQRSLVLLNRNAHVEEEDARRDDREHNNVDVKEPLPIAGPISRIEFTSDTHIRVEGATQIFEQDIPAYGKVRDITNYRITAALPKQFVDEYKTIPIFGWVCK